MQKKYYLLLVEKSVEKIAIFLYLLALNVLINPYESWTRKLTNKGKLKKWRIILIV